MTAITEDGASAPVPYATKSAAADSAPTIEPGSEEIQDAVTVTYTVG